MHDILHERNESGVWTTSVSVYPKLRLDPAWLEAELKGLGLQTNLMPGPRGMVCLTGVLRDE
ncbi:MAG: hypothetical protein WC828_08840 [Thermoleophilia bacterium]